MKIQIEIRIHIQVKIQMKIQMQMKTQPNAGEGALRPGHPSCASAAGSIRGRPEPPPPCTLMHAGSGAPRGAGPPRPRRRAPRPRAATSRPWAPGTPPPGGSPGPMADPCLERGEHPRFVHPSTQTSFSFFGKTPEHPGVEKPASARARPPRGEEKSGKRKNRKPENKQMYFYLCF